MTNKLRQGRFIKIFGLTIISLLVIGLLMQIQKTKASDLNSGLIGYWRFEETSGYVVNDSSGNDNKGYLGRAMLHGFLGQVGSALMFDGNKYITMGDLDALDFGADDSFTVSAWVKLDNSIRNYKAILGKAKASSMDGYTLRYNTDGNFGMMIESSDGDKEINVIANGDYRDEKWHLVTGIINRVDNTNTIYVDGFKKNSADISQVGSLSNSVHFNIGALENNSIFFNGFMDEVRVYDRALSNNEVIQLYNQECNCSGVQIGSLLRAKNEYKVYYINNKGQKKWILNETVFYLYNNKWEDVIKVEPSDLNAYPTINLLRAIGDYKVYYVSGNTKQWIETIQKFNSQGYNWHDIDNVLAGELAQYIEK